jgi:hypothetical protein
LPHGWRRAWVHRPPPLLLCYRRQQRNVADLPSNPHTSFSARVNQLFRQPGRSAFSTYSAVCRDMPSPRKRFAPDGLAPDETRAMRGLLGRNHAHQFSTYTRSVGRPTLTHPACCSLDGNVGILRHVPGQLGVDQRSACRLIPVLEGEPRDGGLAGNHSRDSRKLRHLGEHWNGRGSRASRRLCRRGGGGGGRGRSCWRSICRFCRRGRARPSAPCRILDLHFVIVIVVLVLSVAVVRDGQLSIFALLVVGRRRMVWMLVVHVVADADELARPVGTREQDNRDAQNVRRRDARWVWGRHLQDKLEPACIVCGQQDRVQLLI